MCRLASDAGVLLARLDVSILNGMKDLPFGCWRFEVVVSGWNDLNMVEESGGRRGESVGSKTKSVRRKRSVGRRAEIRLGSRGKRSCIDTFT